MRRKLKDAFTRSAKGLRKAFCMASAGVVMALAADAALPQMAFPEPGAPPPPPATARIDEGVTYWKHPDYDMVAKVWPCPERGLCASVYAINPDDAKNKTLMAQLKGYGKPSKWGFGYDPDPDQVESWEIPAWCGYQADVKLEKTEFGYWSGTITSPFNYKTYGLDIDQTADNEVRVWGYMKGFPLIKLSERAARVATPPPPCTPPAPPPPIG